MSSKATMSEKPEKTEKPKKTEKTEKKTEKKSPQKRSREKKKKTIWKRLNKSGNSLASGSWGYDIIKCIDALGKETFTIKELNTLEAKLKSWHPDNNNIAAKIRQQVRVLKENGFLEEIAADGSVVKTGTTKKAKKTDVVEEFVFVPVVSGTPVSGTSVQISLEPQKTSYEGHDPIADLFDGVSDIEDDDDDNIEQVEI